MSEKIRPTPGAGAVVLKDGKVLLVKRGCEPKKGCWAVPGGRVRTGETLREAAERETMEETGVRVRCTEPVWTFDLIEKDARGRVRFHYVITDLAAEYLGGEVRPGDDAAEARWVSAEELAGLDVTPTTLELLRSRLKLPFRPSPSRERP